jgi:hypothetical protein
VEEVVGEAAQPVLLRGPGGVAPRWRRECDSMMLASIAMGRPDQFFS